MGQRAKGARVDLGNSVEGYLRASELARERVEDARTILNEGDEIETRMIGVDRKSRSISLSVKAKEHYEESQAVEEYGQSSEGGNTTLGDLLKEHISSDNGA